MTQFNIKLEETLFYEKLFSQCDLQKSGKVSGMEAYKLFLKSGMSIDDLKKICEYCGANRLGFFGRSQFYIALKIISLAQAGIDVDENILKKNVFHTLPRFDHEVSEEVYKTVQISAELPQVIPPPPNKHHMRTLSGNNILNSIPLSNRYSYSSPISKSMLQNVSEDILDQFTCEGKLSNRVIPIAADGCVDKDEDGEEDDNVWDGYTEEDNKGLLDPKIKTDFDVFYHKNDGGDDNEFSSSSDHDSSPFSYESDENDENVDVNFKDNNPTGYTLMEVVEGLAAVPPLDNSNDIMPMATHEQLDYYTRCFHTMPAGDNGKVCSSSSIDFFQMHNLSEDCLDKILHLTSIIPDCHITLIQFSRALHLITHAKSGFSIPESLPENLLPHEFEQPGMLPIIYARCVALRRRHNKAKHKLLIYCFCSYLCFRSFIDEPFSFDLSDGERPYAPNNYQVSSVESSYSADEDSSSFDFTDVAVNRKWAQSKQHTETGNHKGAPLFKLSKSMNSDTKNSLRDEIAPLSRPRPFAKKSLSLPQTIPSTVAPPPPPRSSIPTEAFKKKSSFDSGPEPPGESFSTALYNSLAKDVDDHFRKLSDSSKSDYTTTVKYSSNQETRKQIHANIRELKSKNHVLLRLNNEMTSELEEMREQRVNLSLQLEYINQSQSDIQ